MLGGSILCFFIDHAKIGKEKEKDIFSDHNGKYLYTEYSIEYVCGRCNKLLSTVHGTKRKNL